jgi:hypothetical protein
MKRQNATGERRPLKWRFQIEHFDQRLKSLVGEDFSRFRVWAAANAVIAAAMVAINLGFWTFPIGVNLFDILCDLFLVRQRVVSHDCGIGVLEGGTVEAGKYRT